MRQLDYEDDGRTVADMSGLDRPGLFGTRGKKENTQPSDTEGERQRLTKRERRVYCFAALKAALLIGGIFLAAGAVFFLFCQFIWFR